MNTGCHELDASGSMGFVPISNIDSWYMENVFVLESSIYSNSQEDI